MPWPPEYSVRRSHRAKRIIFRVTQQKGLEVVLPHYANMKAITPAMNEARHWIEKHLPTILQTQQLAANPPKVEQLELTAINETWPIVYLPDDRALKLKALSGTLFFHGHADQIEEHYALLLRWLKRHARARLVPLLHQLSEQHQLPFNQISIRAQKGRWGSCSSRKNINLNCLLLFLPEPLVRHVMLHELTHTIHMNHSNAFWQFLEKLDPLSKKHDAMLNPASNNLPEWIKLALS